MGIGLGWLRGRQARAGPTGWPKGSYQGGAQPAPRPRPFAVQDTLPNQRARGNHAQPLPSYPASGSSEDKTAALLADVTSNRWYLDPLYLASYPIEIPEYIEHLPSGWQEDLATIALPTDFLGVNYYTRQVVTLDPETGRARHVDLENERMDSGWEVYPDGLRVLLERLAADYRAPSIYITENGAAYADAPDSQGRVHDERRTDYLRRHLSAVADAIAAGARIDGYFVWSLLDNFEWGSGYDDNTRFGIVYVDFESQERFMKDSGRWYASLIAAHGGEREG